MSFKNYLAEERVNVQVYHGSGTRFDKFDQGKARIVNDFYGGGVAYFTNDMKIGIQYAKSMSKKTKTPFVYTVQLKLKKVFDVDHIFTGKTLVEILPKDVDKFARGAGLLGLNSNQFKVISELKSGKAKLTGDQVFKGLSSGMSQTAAARKHLMSKGYTGLRYNGGLNMGTAVKHDVYLAYFAKDITIMKRQVVKKKVKERTS